MRNWSARPVWGRLRIPAAALKSTFTPISERRGLRAALLGLGLLALAGCEDLDGFGSLGLAPPPEKTSITVSRSMLTIAGPQGFCVYPGATKDKDGQSFVLLGNCAAIVESPKLVQPRIQALLTAAVRETDLLRVATNGDELAAFLRTEAGREALSRDRDPATVEILDSFQKGDVLYVHARDSSAGYAPGMTAEHWRALFDLNGRIVSVAVLGFETDPISRDQGLRTVRDFANTIRKRNPSNPES